MAIAIFEMILHDKCGPFELKIIELEALLREKENIIIEMRKQISYLEERLNNLKDKAHDQDLQH
jgi:uncharacterized coiled-coil protein SlyX